MGKDEGKGIYIASTEEYQLSTAQSNVAMIDLQMWDTSLFAYDLKVKKFDDVSITTESTIYEDYTYVINRHDGSVTLFQGDEKKEEMGHIHVEHIKMLNERCMEVERDIQRQIEVAIERTNDYSDYFFHTNMRNSKGYGKEEYYRLVYINEYGDLQPFNERVFDSWDDLKYWVEHSTDLSVIDYDGIVNKVHEYRTQPETQEIRNNYHIELQQLIEGMRKAGWEYRLAYGQKTFWYKQDSLTDFVEEKDFSDFQKAYFFLDEIIKEQEEMEKEQNENVKIEEETLHLEEEKKSPKDELIEKLRNGVASTLDSEKFAAWCKSQSKLFYNNYSFKNAFLTVLQNPNASYVCGYESWKAYGRQVKKGAVGIKLFAPVFVQEYGKKGSLLSSIKKTCKEQFIKEPEKEFAFFELGQSGLVFKMYKNELWDIALKDRIIASHITTDGLRKLLDDRIIGKVPSGYRVTTVFDISDTTTEVEYLWVNKNACREDEIVYDENNKPVTNQRGQVKIRNSQERINSFTVGSYLEQNLKEESQEKMQLLYDSLKQISEKNGIPFFEETSSRDGTLKDAYGYYQHPSQDFPNGKIVIREELPLTDKVSVAFQEIAHSEMHRDIEKLKEDMGNAETKVTRSMKEVQAEAVAFMSASAFGIETEHKSFFYLADWSNGRELTELESSLEVIYKESQSLLARIEEELDAKGYSMNFKVKDNEPLQQEEKDVFVKGQKEFILNTIQKNEGVKEEILNDLKSFEQTEQQTILKEQLLVLVDIDKKLNVMDAKVEHFQEAGDRQGQMDLMYQLKADREQITMLEHKFENLSVERIENARESLEEKEDMQLLFVSEPMKAFDTLKKTFPQFERITETDAQILSSSEYINKKANLLLNKDTEAFVGAALDYLDKFKSILSKNGIAVEICICEQWGEEPVFEEGQLLHPKKANEIIKYAETEIRGLKIQADKENGYYPYTKCRMILYHCPKDGNLTTLETRIDIGDGEQIDLSDHLTQITNKKNDTDISFMNDYEKSLRERPKKLMEFPEPEKINEQKNAYEQEERIQLPVKEEWEMAVSQNDNFYKNQQEELNREVEKSDKHREEINMTV